MDFMRRKGDVIAETKTARTTAAYVSGSITPSLNANAAIMKLNSPRQVMERPVTTISRRYGL